MNIQFTPPGGGNAIWLAGPDPTGRTSLSWPINGKLNPQWQEQVVPGLRAAAGQVLNRGNMITELDFSVRQTFPTIVAAWTFALGLAAQLNVLDSAGTSGGMVFLQAVDGGTKVNFYIANAVVHFAMPAQIGVDMKFDFRIRGGAITTMNPNQASPQQ